MILALLLHLFAAQHVNASIVYSGDPPPKFIELSIPAPEGLENTFYKFSYRVPQTVSSSPTFTFTIPVPNGCTATVIASNVVISCPTSGTPPLSIISPVILPTATVGQAYTANLAALVAPSGGVPPYSYKAVDGFPAWSKLSSAGILTGTPSAPCNCVLKFLVTDSAGGTQSAQGSSLPVAAAAPAGSH